MDVIWRDDIQAIAFRPEGHAALCMVHRLAIRTLLGFPPGPQDCLAFAREQEARLQAAARGKIAARNIPAGKALHLTSRDIRRSMPDGGSPQSRT